MLKINKLLFALVIGDWHTGKYFHVIDQLQLTRTVNMEFVECFILAYISWWTFNKNVQEKYICYRYHEHSLFGRILHRLIELRILPMSFSSSSLQYCGYKYLYDNEERHRASSFSLSLATIIKRTGHVLLCFEKS